MSATELSAAAVLEVLVGTTTNLWNRLEDLNQADQQEIHAAVTVALLRRVIVMRHPDGLDDAALLRWVTSIRTTMLPARGSLNAGCAEDMIRAIFGKPDATDGYSEQDKAIAQLVLLTAAVEQLGLDEEALGDYIARACHDAERWLAG